MSAVLKAVRALVRGVGKGYPQHAGMVIVCDGTQAADARIARILFNDLASGVTRHADAGCKDAQVCARALKLPGLALSAASQAGAA